MLELRAISRTYTRPTGEAVHALAGVSLRVDRGEFVAIVGASGSGKSTLMNVIGLLDAPTSGQYLFEGRDVAGLGVAEQARFRNKSVGFVFQAFHLLPRTSALENVELPLLYSDRASFGNLGTRALEAVGLTDRIRHTPSELSGGEQQRVAIARALVNDPVLILADEPTGNLDPDLSFEIMNLFREINARGTTVVVATHDRELIRRVGRRTLALDHGRVVDG